MARHIITQLMCDMTGAVDESVQEVVFGLGDRTYKIDLVEELAKELREYLGKFIENATVVTGKRQVRKVAATPGRSKEESDAIRAWGNTNGFEVSASGRIPQVVIGAYEAAQNEPEPEPKPKRTRKSAPAAEFKS